MIEVSKGIIVLIPVNEKELYEDITIIYKNKAYNLLRMFNDGSIEIFLLTEFLIIPYTDASIIVIEDDYDNKIYHLDREEIDKILLNNLIDKVVYFTSYNRMVTGEYYLNNGKTQIRIKQKTPLLSAKIEFPKTVQLIPEKTMLDDNDDLNFEVYLSPEIIPMGVSCEGCPYYHYLYFPNPESKLQRFKIPYCLFLKQGSLHNMSEKDIKFLSATLNQTPEELVETDTGIFGLDVLYEKIKECNINL